MLKQLIALTFLTFTILIHPATSWAAPTDYTFEIDWLIGELAGTSSTVFVTLDGVTGVGIEDFSPNNYVCDEFDCVLIPDGVLEFQTTIDGRTMNAETYVVYGSYPQIRLTDNNLTSVRYTLNPEGEAVFSLSETGNALLDFSSGEDQSLGFYDVNSWTNVSSVPIPAAAWLFGSALLGLGVVKRRRA